MLRRSLQQSSPWRTRAVCLFCAARASSQPFPVRWYANRAPPKKPRAPRKKTAGGKDGEDPELISYHVAKDSAEATTQARVRKINNPNPVRKVEKAPVRKVSRPKPVRKVEVSTLVRKVDNPKPVLKVHTPKPSRRVHNLNPVRKVDIPKPVSKTISTDRTDEDVLQATGPRKPRGPGTGGSAAMSLREALLGKEPTGKVARERRMQREQQLDIQTIEAQDLTFEPIEVEIPPVPMLSYGLDRVLFNPGIYRLQDPRSRIYNFDPYLEKIMPVNEFDFDALSEYKTSSKDEALLSLTKRLGTKFTGSTSSMSSVLQHFHYLLSSFRELNHAMMSRGYPEPSKRFSKITLGPSAIFLRYKDGIYAIDADKTYDSPNIMSWLGHSLEKLLTTSRSEFESFRRSSPEPAPAEDNSSRCYHYSKQGNMLMRSQLDAHDPRLPGTGVFDLKTRAVVSIRMNHKEYEQGSGYQLRFAQGEWESFEREFYDMTRATLLKYSLQVRMGRMDGIFLAYHNIERIFGFQYLSLAEMDKVLHGQNDTALGDQEFKLSIGLMDEILSKATEKFPGTSIRLHFETRDAKTPFTYVFAEPVTEEQADEIQGAGEAAQKEFARTVVGLGKNEDEVQTAWKDIQDSVDQQLDKDEEGKSVKTGEEQESEDGLLTEIADKATEQDVAEETSEEMLEQEVADETIEERSGGEEEVMEETAEVNYEEEATAQPVEEELEDEFDSRDVSPEEAEVAPAPEPQNPGPLVGWTLTTRSKINGGYVDRPRKLTETDEWKVEYHIQEIPEDSCWKLYNALKDRRQSLISTDDNEVDKSLQSYRGMIQRFSNRGRAWREKQDKIDAEMGVQVFRPLGPGSEAEAKATADAVETAP